MGRRIDLDAVRAARRRLKAIAVEHPELLGESSADEWAEALEEIEQMAKTIQVGVRFPEEVVALIDSFAEKTTAELRKNLPGLEVNRAGAIRILVEKALAELGYAGTQADTNRKARSSSKHGKQKRS